MGEADETPSYPLGAAWLLSYRDYHERHPYSYTQRDAGETRLHGAWGTTDVFFVEQADDARLRNTLNSVRLPRSFDAIVHTGENLIEFLFAYIDATDPTEGPIVNRSFDFSFEGTGFQCYFAEPSEAVYALAAHVSRYPNFNEAEVAPQLNLFREVASLSTLDATRQSVIESYVEGKVPRSFFISGPVEEVDLVDIAKHLNRLAKYFDRRSPEIVIREAVEKPLPTPKTGCHFPRKKFPLSIAGRRIDDVMMQLLTTAAESTPRAAFLYYYQVIEYAAFHYIDSRTRSRVQQLLRDPAIVSCDDEQLARIIDAFTEGNQDDRRKMELVVEEHVTIDVVSAELDEDRDFFASETMFDGGYVAKALLKGVGHADLAALRLDAVVTELRGIRNVLVHAREKRENRVILPTRENHWKLRHYVPLVRRIAEDISFRS